MQAGDLLKEAGEFSLVCLLLCPQFGRHSGKFCPAAAKLILLLAAAQLYLFTEPIDQLAELGVFVEELGVLLEEDLQLGPQFALPAMFLLVERWGVRSRRPLGEVGIARDSGVADVALLGAEDRPERTR